MLASLEDHFEEQGKFFFSRCPDKILKNASKKAKIIKYHRYLYYGQV